MFQKVVLWVLVGLPFFIGFELVAVLTSWLDWRSVPFGFWPGYLTARLLLNILPKPKKPQELEP